MSHFTVLVSANNDDELERILLPYHEYECTGIEAYTQFVPADMEKAKENWGEYGEDYNSFQEFMKDYYGYNQENGVWGRKTNPNAKWDWWVIGGRWTGMLQLKSGCVGRNGKAGLIMTEPNTDITKADIAMSGDVDWQQMHDSDLQYKIDKFMERKHYFHLAGNEDIPDELLENSFEKYESEDWRGGKYRETFESPIQLAQFELAKKLSNDNFLYFITWDEITQMLKWDKKKFKAMNTGKAQTYAFINEKGEWCQRGEMGWFGIDDSEGATDNYDEAWWTFVKNLPEDKLVYVIDCHI